MTTNEFIILIFLFFLCALPITNPILCEWYLTWSFLPQYYDNFSNSRNLYSFTLALSHVNKTHLLNSIHCELRDRENHEKLRGHDRRCLPGYDLLFFCVKVFTSSFPHTFLFFSDLCCPLSSCYCSSSCCFCATNL